MESIPAIKAPFSELFQKEKNISIFEQGILPIYLKKVRWFGGKARQIMAVKIYRYFSLPNCDDAHWMLVKVRYDGYPTEIYSLPVAYVKEFDYDTTPSEAVIARLSSDDKSGYLIDAIYSAVFRSAMFEVMLKNSEVHLEQNDAFGECGSYLAELNYSSAPLSRVLKAEQSNSSIIYGEKLFFKLFRKLEYAVNPDYEIIRFLSTETTFKNIPIFAGSISLTHREKPNMLLGMMQAMVPNQGDAWQHFLKQVRSFYQNIMNSGSVNPKFPEKPKQLSLVYADVPEVLKPFIPEDLADQVQLLGKRTAELHLALAKNTSDANFSPEIFDSSYTHYLSVQIETLIDLKFSLLSKNLDKLSAYWREEATDMLNDVSKVKEFFHSALSHSFKGKRIRIHGDYHLGQVLESNGDFIILDFEGEPDKPHNERRLKYSPLKDVAGMMRSFRYAAYAVLFNEYGNDAAQRERLMNWADQWYHYISRFYLGAYLNQMKESDLLPEERQIVTLLQLFSFEKAIYELGYEINNRPDWTVIPLSSLTKFVKYYLHEH
jgi:maltose alpha-D-glucosyltransferase/alpha-amylase